MHVRTMLAAGAALIAATFYMPAFAVADNKSAYEFQGRLLDVTVTIDGALKKYTGLFDNLLTEGKRDAARWNTRAEQDSKKYRDLYRDGHRDDYQRGYSERSLVGNRYVSIVRGDHVEGGGTHHNHFTDTIVWDAEAKKRFNIPSFFKETADNGPTLTALAKAIRAALAVEKKARDIEAMQTKTRWQ